MVTFNKNALVGQIIASADNIFSNFTQNAFIPQRKIADFADFVVLSENSTDQLEVTSNPVQTGGVISDHAYLKPAELTISFVCNDKTNELWRTYEILREMQAKREPSQVVTGKRFYENMLIKSLQVATDKTTENILSVTCDLIEVKMADAQATTMAPRDMQKMPQKTGTQQNLGNKQVQKASAQEKAEAESALHQGARGFSSLFGG